MTEEIAATPGWVDERLEELFASLPGSEAVQTARAAYAICLAGDKAPGAPSDTLGSEFATCRLALNRSLRAAGIETGPLEGALEALEAEIAGGS